MGEVFDSSLEAYDWRYSAAIVGLYRYLNHFELPFNKDEIMSRKELDCLRYNRADITEERYLQFAEEFYDEEFQHKKAERMLAQDNFEEDTIKEINALLTANTILKKFFSKEKFDGTNKEKILQIINENRAEIIRETFRNKTNMYRNYCNTNLLFSEGQTVCRVNGYYVDWGKKGKSASYGFDTNRFLGRDIMEFDFIPFAFTENVDGYFINYSTSILDLVRSNEMMEMALERAKSDAKDAGKRISIKQVLFEELIYASDYFNYDVELIMKQRNHDYFETLFLRKASISIFKSMKTWPSKRVFQQSFKVTDDYYRFALQEVMDAIINLTALDDLIQYVLKQQEKAPNYGALLTSLISVNTKIYRTLYGGEKMNKKAIKECARKIALNVEENKLSAYRTKLTSSLVFRDYSRVCEILLQLSNYAKVSLDSMLNVFEDCEKNKNSVYLFVACLRKAQIEDVNEGGEQ